MPDIQDMLIQSIQNYARSAGSINMETQIALLALAEELGTFMAADLDMVQEWAVGIYVPRHGVELLDDLDGEDFDRERALRHLNQLPLTNGYERRALVTRAYMEWIEDVEPALDAELVELVEKDQ
jgi:hypothetical protein